MSATADTVPVAARAEASAPEPGPDERRVERYDFRRPSKFGREHVHSLEVAHEVFIRRFSSGLGAALRGMLQLEPLSADQVSYDDYIRSLPNPSVLTVFALPPLPGAAIVELNTSLALVLVDRLLGGQGQGGELRRPTELEAHLLRELMGHAATAFRETLEPLFAVEPEITALEFNPQLVQVAAPSDMVLLLSYRAAASHGHRAEGMLTLCYPFSTLAPAMSRLVTHLWDEGAAAGSLEAGDGESELLRSGLNEVPVELSVQLRESTITPRELLALQPGDVLRLEHPTDEPVHGRVAGSDVLRGHLGRRRRRLALQVQDWIADALPGGAT